MPVRVLECASPANPVGIAYGGFTELPYVEDTGGRGVAHEAGRPSASSPVGEDDLGIEVLSVDLGRVGAIPPPFFVGVLLRASWGTIGDSGLAVVAAPVPMGGVVGLHGAAIPITHVPRLGWPRLHEAKAMAHEDKTLGTVLAAGADVLVFGDDGSFCDGLRVVTVRARVVAVGAEVIMAVGQVRASAARCLHTH